MLRSIDTVCIMVHDIIDGIIFPDVSWSGRGHSKQSKGTAKGNEFSS